MTGRWLALVAFCVALGAGAQPAAGQVQVSASLDVSSTPVGQGVRLIVTVTGADREIVPPTLPDLPGVDSFSAGQSQRFSFVNGQSRAEYSWSWSLVPRREGEVTIPAVRVNVDGRDHFTAPLQLSVSAAVSRPSTGTPPAAGDQTASDAPDAFVSMRVDQDTVVIGEQVILTFGFYRAARTSMFESPAYTAPRSEGFWREDLPPERHRREVIRSRRYEVTEIQYALFPTRVGDLEISEATVRLPDDAFGSFFRRSARRQGPSILSTEPITVHVKPLPDPQPADFSGTVASGLKLRSSVDRRDLEQGDALTWRIRLEGTGHLDAAQLPTPDLGPEFKVHESANSSESGPDNGRLRGSRTVEYLVIPQQPGELVIPALDYAWFDSGRQEYARARTEAIPIRVSPSEGSTASVFTGGRKSEIELLARDIHYIEPVGDEDDAWDGPLTSRPTFWALLGAGPVAWGFSTVFSRRRRALLADPGRLRARNARSKARATLASDVPVDLRVRSAVEGYLADRSDRAASGMVREEMASILRGASISEELVARTLAVLERSDVLRFAPSSGSEDTLLVDAQALIDDLEEAFHA